jgi:hypothetical protein
MTRPVIFPEGIMYSIEPTSYGFKLVFGGVMNGTEVDRWLEESRRALQGHAPDFCVFVDMRTLGPLDKEGRDAMRRGQAMYLNHGMKRSVVILSNPVTTQQFKSIAWESGIAETERYIDASADPDWETTALNWLLDGVEPPRRNLAVKVE